MSGEPLDIRWLSELEAKLSEAVAKLENYDYEAHGISPPSADAIKVQRELLDIIGEVRTMRRNGASDEEIVAYLDTTPLSPE